MAKFKKGRNEKSKSVNNNTIGRESKKTNYKNHRGKGKNAKIINKGR
jgi:hypothetical protein